MAQRLSLLLKACELIVLPLCQNSFQVRFLKFPPWVVTLKVISQSAMPFTQYFPHRHCISDMLSNV